MNVFKNLFNDDNKKRIIIVSLVAIAIVSASGYATYQYQVEQERIEQERIAEEKRKAKEREEKKLDELRKEHAIEGIASMLSDKYANVIVDDEKSLILNYEEYMMTTHKVEDFEKYKGELDKLVAQLDTRLSEWEAEQQRIAEEEARKAAEAAAAQEAAQQEVQQQSSVHQSGGGSGGGNIDLRSAGVVNWGGYRFTWYSQKTLPGGGLNIPGRHVNGAGFVCDGDGYIVAATAFGRGTTGDSPWGAWKSYDTVVSSNTVDLYCNW